MEHGLFDDYVRVRRYDMRSAILCTKSFLSVVMISNCFTFDLFIFLLICLFKILFYLLETLYINRTFLYLILYRFLDVKIDIKFVVYLPFRDNFSVLYIYIYKDLYTFLN